MQKYFVADEYLLSSPPLMKGDWSEMYLASEVDAKFKEYDDDNLALSQSVSKLGARIAELEITAKPLYSRRQIEARVAALEKALRRAEELFQDECDPVSEPDSYAWLQDIRSLMERGA